LELDPNSRFGVLLGIKPLKLMPQCVSSIPDRSVVSRREVFSLSQRLDADDVLLQITGAPSDLSFANIAKESLELIGTCEGVAIENQLQRRLFVLGTWPPIALDHRPTFIHWPDYIALGCCLLTFRLTFRHGPDTFFPQAPRAQSVSVVKG
jgi:hypothetical protein